MTAERFLASKRPSRIAKEKEPISSITNGHKGKLERARFFELVKASMLQVYDLMRA
ncbi:unnamed protein product [Acidithrix sp. C25]|nr:unnamed protein product [Acidithrix sp. C25]